MAGAMADDAASQTGARLSHFEGTIIHKGKIAISLAKTYVGTRREVQLGDKVLTFGRFRTVQRAKEPSEFA